MTYKSLICQSRNILSVTLLSCLLFTPCQLFAQTYEQSLLDSLMSQIGMTSEDVRFDEDEMAIFQGELWRLDHFTMLHKNPLKLPKYSELTLAATNENLVNPKGLVGLAARLVDYPIRRGLIGNPLSRYIDTNGVVTKGSVTKGKNILNGAQFRQLRNKIDLIYSIADDKQFLLHRALREIDNNGNRNRVVTYLLSDEDDEETPKPRKRTGLIDNFRNVVTDQRSEGLYVEELVGKVDWWWFYAGVQDLAAACQFVADSLELSPGPDKVINIETNKGRIVIGTAGDDRFEFLEVPLLIIDLGGNDYYSFSGNNTECSFSVIIDASGNDTYESKDTLRPGIGAGVMSASILIDKSGNDRYLGENVCFGTGIFGAGILIDHSGDDYYKGKLYTQGAGAFGIGILADSSGNDTLRCYGMAQGFGYSRGCGILASGTGDDLYEAEDSILFLPSPQTAEHNVSMAQGVGYGKRADYTDGHSWAGGVGALADASGDDTYRAALFAQGCSYWYSVGMLLEGAGEDHYDGVWYVQGSGAHFGVAILDDFGGDDFYNATKNMAQGAGHDFTIGVLSERAGNDTYTAPNLSLGGGNANGIGLFIEWTGNDTYNTSPSVTLGRANAEPNGMRRYQRVFGLFIDAGGEDTYKEKYSANNIHWRGPASRPQADSPYEIGLGIDLGEQK